MKSNIYKTTIIFLAIFLSAVYYKTFISADITLVSRVRGKILLQVEKNGEAWYVAPHTDERYFLGRPKDAFAMMQTLGVGITDEDIIKIPVAPVNLEGTDTDGDGLSDIFEDAIGTDKNLADTDKDGYNDKTEVLNNFNPVSSQKINLDAQFAEKQSGKILIQVQKNGEAWYVNTIDHKRYFLGRPADAFNVMRELGLGITNDDLAQIPEYHINDELHNDELIKKYTIIPKNTSGKRRYSDSNYPYSFEYPSNWKIKKSSDFDHILFLGDYLTNMFKERKGFFSIAYIKNDTETNLDNFIIKEKEGAKKIEEQKTTINEKPALKQTFEYSNISSFEITTQIMINDKEFLQVIMMAAGNQNAYEKINNDLLNSIIITK